MKPRIKTMQTFAISSLWLFLFLFVFSCSRQPNSPLGNGQSSLDTDEVPAIYKSEPFAYDGIVDTISYNSCYNANIDNSGMYAFNVSASENPLFDESPRSGIRVSKKYLDFVGSRINPAYPEESITQKQLQTFISGSPLNKNAIPMVSVRRAQTLSIVPQDLTSTSFVVRKDFYPVLDVLSNIHFITSLIEGIIYGPDNKVMSQGPRINDFIYTDDGTRSLNAKLGYNLATSEELYTVQMRREFLRRNYILALTFHDNTATDFAINPLSPTPTNLKRAYGRGYYLGFTTVATASHNSIPNNLLNSIEERDLETDSLVVGATWSCRQYMVVRNEDKDEPQGGTAPVAGGKLVLPLTYSDLIGAHTYHINELGQQMTGLEIVREIRKQYSAADWDIGRLNQDTTAGGTSPVTDLIFVVVPKVAACYDAAKNISSSDPDPGVDYTPWNNADDYVAGQNSSTQGCFQASFAAQGISYYTAAPKKRCANWVSICNRRSVSY